MLHRHSWFPAFILSTLRLRLNPFLSVARRLLDQLPARLTLLIEFLLDDHEGGVDEGAPEQLGLEQAE